jgi:hypothetical protein
MGLDDLIETASSNRPLALADVEATARQVGLAVPDVLDLFARTVAMRYLKGDYSYGHADMAMNQLFGFAHAVSGVGLPEFAWQVFGAFDEGEYIHDGEPPEQQGESRTRELLGRIGLLSGA